MIEMRENSYINIRKDEIKRLDEKENTGKETTSGDKQNNIPENFRTSNNQDQFEEYDPWC